MEGSRLLIFASARANCSSIFRGISPSSLSLELVPESSSDPPSPMMYSRLSFSCSRCVSSRRLLCSNLAANFSLIVNESLAPLTFSPLSEPPPLPLSEPLLLPLSESEPLSLSLSLSNISFAFAISEDVSRGETCVPEINDRRPPAAARLGEMIESNARAPLPHRVTRRRASFARFASRDSNRRTPRRTPSSAGRRRGPSAPSHG